MYSLMLLAMVGSGQLTVTSTAFDNNGMIPAVYTCEGKEINPPLALDDVPAGTKSLVLIVEDPDTDHGTFDHWVVWNIKPAKTIDENSKPGTEGKNGTGKNGYKGPCPPTGKHRYFFKVYALDAMLDLKTNAGKMEVEQAMQGHIVARGQLIGLYEKKGK
jgi:Raf kinase inhibitor-like YbhB/YbcL family protein